MKHLIICREYPPAPSGGIGTYVHHISRLLAASGETVHIIGQLWGKAGKTIEEHCDGKLIIHRVPFEDSATFLGPRASPLMRSKVARALYASDFPPQCFSWLAGALAERLVEEEGIDIIEAQDYEAPLYYFQLRRALGLGPKRRPPCFLHLHSPTEFVARYNDWSMALPRYLTAKRLEDYSLSAADALLCPSRFLAREAEAHYRAPRDSIEVIPYPMGDIAIMERVQETWSTGSVCYVGRLEKRKGVLEWIDAAVNIAQHYPMAHFAFVGANVLGPNLLLSEEVLSRLIPCHLQARFRFHGAVHRSTIPQFLMRARMAVVPSRWENFPNTCVEAMASGLPVIASAEGGMVEMITDDQTGWIAQKGDSEGLQKALRRALDTSPIRVAEMGRNAAQSIHELCDKKKIVEQHLRFRSHLVNRGLTGSLTLPLAPPSRRAPASKNKRRGEITLVEVLADYTGNGLQPAATNPRSEVTSSDLLERFSELVVQETEESVAQTVPSVAISGSEWNGNLHAPLATIRCLLGNPKISLRVFQQLAARLAKRTKT